MTYAAVKEKLHNFIENADQKKIKAIYTVLADDLEDGSFVYDDATLAMLEERSNQIFSGKAETHTAEESLDYIREHRKKNGV